MRKALWVGLLCGSLVCALSTDSQARGRGRPRGGVVMGPFGPLYDTRSPEWRMSGGNFLVYQQLMEAKMETQRERFILEQTRRAEKLQNAKAKGKTGAANSQTNAQPPQPQFNQPVWVDEFGQPVVNHYHPRKRARPPPGATKPTAEKPAKP